MRSRITLEQNVKGLNIWAGLLTAAIGAMFLFFLLRIDDRFDRVDEPLGKLETSVAAQAEALKSVNERLGQIDGRLDRTGTNEPQRSSGTGQAQPIREGTRERPVRR